MREREPSGWRMETTRSNDEIEKAKKPISATKTSCAAAAIYTQSYVIER